MERKQPCRSNKQPYAATGGDENDSQESVQESVSRIKPGTEINPSIVNIHLTLLSQISASIEQCTS